MKLFCRLILHGKRQGGKINEQQQITEKQETSIICGNIALLLALDYYKITYFFITRFYSFDFLSKLFLFFYSWKVKFDLKKLRIPLCF